MEDEGCAGCTSDVNQNERDDGKGINVLQKSDENGNSKVAVPCEMTRAPTVIHLGLDRLSIE